MKRKVIEPTKKEIIELYVTKKLSTRECAEKLGMSQPWFRKFMKLHKIPARGSHEYPGSNLGRKFSEEHKNKISKGLTKNNAMRYKFFSAHPNFKYGIRSYRKYLTRGFLMPFCSTCNTEKNLVVHHMDRNRLNNNLSNLKVLCASCHKKWHLVNPSPETIDRMRTLLSNFPNIGA